MSKTISTKSDQPTRAFLISVYKGKTPFQLCQEHVDELGLLSETFGLEVIKKNTCQIRRFDAATLITEGKLEDLVKAAKEEKAELVIFDDEITPSQQRNLEKAFGIPVIDRTELILGVFAQRAQTKEARLQVELARVKYQIPRLKRLWTHLSRQAGTSGGGGSGGGGYLKGTGEKQIETDKRLLKDQIDKLQKELEQVKNYRETQRSARTRTGIPVFSIIGYTNVGKSTLLNTLTSAGVFVEDKLFATLDTTTRKFTLPNNQEILLIDTVGLIRKLPHLLVAAFKSTLEEAIQADVLLHLVDLSSPAAEEQAATTLEVLKELGAEDTPIITVLNKIDACSDRSQLLKFRVKYPKTVAISALQRTGLQELEELMIQEVSKLRIRMLLSIPQADYSVVSEVIRLGNVIDKSYEEDNVILKVDVPNALASKLSKYELK